MSLWSLGRTWELVERSEIEILVGLCSLFLSNLRAKVNLGGAHSGLVLHIPKCSQRNADMLDSCRTKHYAPSGLCLHLQDQTLDIGRPAPACCVTM